VRRVSSPELITFLKRWLKGGAAGFLNGENKIENVAQVFHVAFPTIYVLTFFN